MKETCFIKNCRNTPKFKVSAELVNYTSDVKMCQVHLLMNLRGVSQSIANTISKVIQKMVKENK